VGVADDEVRISTSMDAELEHALARLDQRLSGVEEELGKVRAAGKAAGEGVEAGMDKATRATDKTKRSAEKATPPIREAGNEIGKVGVKAAAASPPVDRFAGKMDKAARSAGGLGSILSIYKWAGIATGVFALAGGVSALAAGAGIAVGGLAPMVGIVGAFPTLFAAAKLSMLAFTLATSAMEDQLTRIKNQFTELGEQIAAGGLRSGLNYFANSLERIADVTGSGLAGLGSELGQAARQAGDIAKSAPFLSQVRAIFSGLRPIVSNVAQGLLYLAQAIVNVISGQPAHGAGHVAAVHRHRGLGEQLDGQHAGQRQDGGVLHQGVGHVSAGRRRDRRHHDRPVQHSAHRRRLCRPAGRLDRGRGL
jgi:hypothetical protein